MDEKQSHKHLFLLLLSFFSWQRLSVSHSPVCLSHHFKTPSPASKQLPLLSLKKMKADESIWPVALKCTCLRPILGGGDNEPID